MNKLIVPALLATAVAGQMIRVERVAAKPVAAQPVAPAKSPAASPAAKDDPAKRREYKEDIWPRYIIEPPDILSIECVKLAPKAPHALEPFDVVLVRVQGAHPEQPIDDTYSVDADGSVNLGPCYGRIKIAGGTIEEAEARLREELAKKLPDVNVSASLVASAGAQQISGQHLVGPDGRVNLGVYGAAYVAGLTLEEARAAIEKKLSAQLDQPQVAVDVLAYNSKVYYVIYKGAKPGDHVTRLPITGNETVLDAVASMGGISSIASNNMWLARPAPNGVGPEQILPVAWNDIARGVSSKTNYQLTPGDRLFVETLPPVENPQAAPTPASRVGDLRVHDVITVLVDYPAADKDRRPSSFRIACEIRDVRPDGNLQIEGKQTIRNNNEQWQISLSGEVRREAILPDCTVSSRSIANLNIDKRVVSAEAAAPAGKVEMEIALIEDDQNTMAEFGDLKTGILMRGDRGTTLGALRALEKAKLIKLIKPESPTVELAIGATTKIEFGGLRAEIASRQLDPSSLVLDVRTFQGQHERSVSVVLDSARQESIMVKLRDDEDDKNRTVYLAILPRWTQ